MSPTLYSEILGNKLPCRALDSHRTLILWMVSHLLILLYLDYVSAFPLFHPCTSIVQNIHYTSMLLVWLVIHTSIKRTHHHKLVTEIQKYNHILRVFIGTHREFGRQGVLRWAASYSDHFILYFWKLKVFDNIILSAMSKAQHRVLLWDSWAGSLPLTS